MPIGTDAQLLCQCSLSELLKRCKTMDEWDELLRNVSGYEWNIHRKLGEAAGLTHRYIVPARGSGKSMFYWDSFDGEWKVKFIEVRGGFVQI